MRIALKMNLPSHFAAAKKEKEASFLELRDLACHVNMCEEERPAAVSFNAQAVQDLFWILTLSGPFLELFPVLPNGLTARHAPDRYYHNPTPNFLNLRRSPSTLKT
jgi:hypothetical protein